MDSVVAIRTFQASAVIALALLAFPQVGASGEQVFAGAGTVTVTFVSSSADFVNFASLASPSSRLLFPCGLAGGAGTTVSLGGFSPGDELIFSLGTMGGGTWFTGPGSRNSDGRAHAIVVQQSSTVYRVFWEDLAGLGDADFNDCVFDVDLAGVGGIPAILPGVPGVGIPGVGGGVPPVGVPLVCPPPLPIKGPDVEHKLFELQEPGVVVAGCQMS